ncbi:MAG: hypothetical protein ACC661_06740 [Verrucomicrobiales bacterium]
MKFECGSCGGHIEAPDEFVDAVIACPHCNEDIYVPHVEGEGGDAQDSRDFQNEAGGEPVYEEAGEVPRHPITPGEFRARQQAKRKRSIIVSLVLAALFCGAAVFLVVTRAPIVMDLLSRLSRSRAESLILAEHGLAPQGYYWSRKLPGMSESDTSFWELEKEDARSYLVVKLAVKPQLFGASEEDYARMKESAEAKNAGDESYVFPGRDQCRVFDSRRFHLGSGEEEDTPGSLVNIHYGTFEGFYEIFQFVDPGSEGEAEAAADELMGVSVAFLVEKQAVDPAALRIRVDDSAVILVPAIDLGAGS